MRQTGDEFVLYIFILLLYYSIIIPLLLLSLIGSEY